MLKAAKLDEFFCTKEWDTQYCAVRHFVRIYDIVYCIGTHVSQRGKEEVAEEAADYFKYLHPQLQDTSCQVLHDKHGSDPSLFSMHPSKTLNTKGASKAYIKCGKHDTKRATL